MSPWFRVLPAALVLLPSCGVLTSRKTEKKEPSPFGSSGIPPQLRGGAGLGGTPVLAGGNQPVNPALITPDDQIAWTDPDNPDKEIPELAALSAAPKRGVWEDNEAIARQRAVRDNKPLLILFIDSARNPACKSLSEELLERKDFDEWARDHFVRLKADLNPVLSVDLSMTAADQKREKLRESLEEMKKRYRVLGYPALIVLAPNGDVIGRYKGFRKGEGAFRWGQLRQAQGLAAKSAEEWRSGLIAKGYREWQDRSGNKVFARLTSYQKGQLYLVEPDGRRSRTSENRLSDADRTWITQQKAQRGIE